PKLVRCPSCGATNRVPLEKIGRGLQPVCGRCKTALPFENKPGEGHRCELCGRGRALAVASAARHVGAVVRTLRDGGAGDRRISSGNGGSRARGKTQCRRESGDGGTLRCPEHSDLTAA